jgi:mono/diheme cytochrome c family protein
VTSIARTAMGPKDPCVFPGTTVGTLTVAAELTAGAYDGAGRLWVQSRNPAQLHILATGQPSTVVNLDGAEDRASEGHRLFHTPTAGMIACASCHAEAGDDGHVWTFDSVGSRRTQTLRGGILATAPFHWDGDMTDLSKLMQDVFVGRMSGRSVTPSQVEAIGKWLDAQPPLPKAPRDAQAAARGKALFYDAKVACSSCHSGQHFTNNRNSDVGTGKAFQVPSLVDLAWRAPYMHTGCGKTLRDRFDPACGGGDKHGVTSHLSSGQIDDLVAYLETL